MNTLPAGQPHRPATGVGLLRDVILAGHATLSQAGFTAAAARAATGFDALGVAEGDAIALLLPNGFAALEATRGANLLGAYTVPIGWHATLDEIRYVLSDACPKLLVIDFDLLVPLLDGLDHAQAMLVVCEGAETERALRGLTKDRPPGRVLVWHGWLAGQAEWQRPARPPRGTIIYTSGTTGRPKGVKRLPLTAEQSADYLDFYRDTFGIEPGLRAYIGGPLYHSMANAFSRAALVMGELLVLQTKFDADALLRLIDEQAITHVLVVPTVFIRLLRLPAARRAAFSGASLRRVYHTGAPCPAYAKQQMIEWLGPKLYEVYGSTEVGAAVLGTSEDWLGHPGSVGRATRGTTIRILDEARRECPAGVPGEVFMRCSAYSDFTYHNRDDLRAEVEHDGLITCGDVGYLDPDGYLFLCDRKRDMVISGGVNIYPAEVEAQLSQMPGVADCAVFGLPDPEFTEAVAAVVECTPGAHLSEEGIQAWLRVKLSAYKVPKRVFFEPVMPRLETGKIKKGELRERYASSAREQ